MALSLTSIEEIWIKKLFVSLGQKQENPTIIHSYNQSAIMFLGFIWELKSKYIDIQTHFVR
jgi:hypothetical protein